MVSVSKQRDFGFIPETALNGLNFQAAYGCNSSHTSRQFQAVDDGSVNAATNSPCCLSWPAVAGFGIFWWLTIPAVVAANALPAYTPDPANGLTTFNAGGCSSCHAVPGQPDRLKLGGGLAITSPFGTFYVAQHLARSGRWHRAMDRGRIRHARCSRARRLRARIIFRPFPIPPTSMPRSKTSAISSPI